MIRNVLKLTCRLAPRRLSLRTALPIPVFSVGDFGMVPSGMCLGFARRDLQQFEAI
jgi:hypothetical protein